MCIRDSYYRENVGPIDVAYFQVAPMDEHGFFNFGPCASHMSAMCERAAKIYVEVNTNMPRCLGGTENGIHISKAVSYTHLNGESQQKETTTRFGGRFPTDRKA